MIHTSNYLCVLQAVELRSAVMIIERLRNVFRVEIMNIWMRKLAPVTCTYVKVSQFVILQVPEFGHFARHLSYLSSFVSTADMDVHICTLFRKSHFSEHCPREENCQNWKMYKKLFSSSLLQFPKSCSTKTKDQSDLVTYIVT